MDSISDKQSSLPGGGLYGQRGAGGGYSRRSRQRSVRGSRRVSRRTSARAPSSSRQLSRRASESRRRKAGGSGGGGGGGSLSQRLSQAKLRSRMCHDIQCVILLLAFLIFSCVVGIWAYSVGEPETLVPSRHALEDGINALPVVNGTVVVDEGIGWFRGTMHQLRRDRIAIFLAVLSSVGLGVLWLILLRLFSRIFLYIVMFGSVVLAFALGGGLMWQGVKHGSSGLQAFAGVVLALAFILLCIVLFIRRRIDLTAAMVTEASRMLQQRPDIFLVGLLVIGIFFCHIAFHVSIMVYLYSVGEEYAPRGENPYYFSKNTLMWIVFFSFLWGTQTVMAIYQTTVAGGVAHNYYSKRNIGADYDIGTNSLITLLRCLSLSLGSVAFGALLVAIVQFLNWVIARVKKKMAGTPVGESLRGLLTCVQCCLKCLEKLIKFINKFAYIYIAMFGYSFLKSAKDVWNLLSKNIATAVIVDQVGGFLLFIGVLMWTALVVVVSYVGIQQTSTHSGGNVSLVTIFVIAVLVFLIFKMISNTIGMAIDTVFVCYCVELDMFDGVTKSKNIDPDLAKLLKANQPWSDVKQKMVEERRQE